MLYNGNIKLYQEIMRKRKLYEKWNKGCILVTEKGHIKDGGPPPGWRGPPPPKSWELFVGRIPPDVSEIELWLLFSTIGEIYEQRFMIDFSGANRGFSFVHYIERHDADRAVAELNNFEIRLEHKIVVAKSFRSMDKRLLFTDRIPKNKGSGFKLYCAFPEVSSDDDDTVEDIMVYVRYLSPTTTEQYLRDILNQVADNDVQGVTMIAGSAFVHFTSHGSAEKAIQAFNGTEINGSKVEVTWANPLQNFKSTKSKPASRKRSSVSVSSVSSLNRYEPVAKRRCQDNQYLNKRGFRT